MTKMAPNFSMPLSSRARPGDLLFSNFELQLQLYSSEKTLKTFCKFFFRFSCACIVHNTDGDTLGSLDTECARWRDWDSLFYLPWRRCGFVLSDIHRADSDWVLDPHIEFWVCGWLADWYHRILWDYSRCSSHFILDLAAVAVFLPFTG